MAQLTQKHFDEQLKRLASKADLENLEAHIDSETFAIKKQLKEGFDSVDLKLEAIYKMLDVRQRMEKHERWLDQLASKIGINLQD